MAQFVNIRNVHTKMEFESFSLADCWLVKCSEGGEDRDRGRAVIRSDLGLQQLLPSILCIIKTSNSFANQKIFKGGVVTRK